MDNGGCADLTGRYAIITGGSQGLGEATARLFAERGAAGLMLCSRDDERGRAVAADITAGGCPTDFMCGDLAEVDTCRRLVARADEVFGSVHALVNCAAITDRGTVLDTTPELFDRMFAINVRAPFFLMQDTAKLMRRDRIEGTIVNIVSVSGYGGQPFVCAYCGSKGALAVLTKNIAFSLMPDRIRVNGLNIGWMDTPGEDRVQRLYHDAGSDWLQKAEAAQPFGRLLKPQEVARAVVFLSTDESGMMTGSLVDFDQSVLGAHESPPHPSARLD